jgi:hypothetical protein
VRGFLLTLLVLAALVLLIVPYFVLPPALENLVARDVQDGLGLAERPGVELESDPQWKILLGEFSSGKVSMGEADLGGVRARSAGIALDPFTMDWGETLRSRTLVSPEPVSGRARLTVSEGEVSRLAGQNAEVPVNGVELKGSGVTVQSEASVLGTTFPVAVDGGVGVEGNALVFQPQTVRAAGMTVPGYLADSLLAGTAFRYPAEGLPYGGRLTGAETLDGAVVLTGRVSEVDLGG